MLNKKLTTTRSIKKIAEIVSYSRVVARFNFGLYRKEIARNQHFHTAKH